MSELDQLNVSNARWKKKNINKNGEKLPGIYKYTQIHMQIQF